MTPRTRRALRATSAALAVPTLLGLTAGCGSGADAASDASSAGNHSSGTTVHVSFTDQGCRPRPTTVPAGPVTFQIANDNASGVTEVEITQHGRILGEKENLTPGLSGTFSLNLDKGTYTVSCPNAAADKSTLTVTGASSKPVVAAPGSADPALQKAVTGYHAYVKGQTAKLVTATKSFAAAVRAGDVAAAKARYGPARVYYERIEPVAESFGNLDPEIDARGGDVADPAEWGGFHRIEKALWQDGTTRGMAPVAAKLVADTGRLQQKVASATYQPAQLANGASSLLDEIAKSKITGEEERYSHLDLLDFSANLQGAKKAYELLRPALIRTDGQLARTIDDRFTAVRKQLDRYRSGDGWAAYGTLSTKDVRALAQSVDALAEPLSEVAAKVVGGR